MCESRTLERNEECGSGNGLGQTDSDTLLVDADKMGPLRSAVSVGRRRLEREVTISQMPTKVQHISDVGRHALVNVEWRILVIAFQF